MNAGASVERRDAASVHDQAAGWNHELVVRGSHSLTHTHRFHCALPASCKLQAASCKLCCESTRMTGSSTTPNKTCKRCASYDPTRKYGAVITIILLYFMYRAATVALFAPDHHTHTHSSAVCGCGSGCRLPSPKKFGGLYRRCTAK